MIKPLPGYVLVQPIEEESKTSAGVYLPESSQDKTMKGTVVAVSEMPWVKDEINGEPIVGQKHPPVEVGQVVYYRKWINETVKDGDKEYLFVKFSDLLGVVE